MLLLSTDDQDTALGNRKSGQQIDIERGDRESRAPMLVTRPQCLGPEVAEGVKNTQMNRLVSGSYISSPVFTRLYNPCVKSNIYI